MKHVLGCGLLAIGLISASKNCSAQGCSDAGFCTAGALQQKAAHDTLKEKSIGLSVTVGSGEQGVATVIPQVEWKQSLSNSWNAEIKLPFYLANGNLGTHYGIGDPIITATKSWTSGKIWETYATLGARVSFTDANAQDNRGLALPMPYQQGLGTTDLILGLSARYRQWLYLSAGYQQPVIQYNNNQYLNNVVPGDADYNAYFNSRKLVRRGDVLLRVEGTYKRKSWTFSGGPLFIYHLGKDRFTGIAVTQQDIQGSDGLTMNLTARIGYTVARSRWQLTGGTPLIVRDVRPDGLTRAWVLTLSYERVLR